MNALTEVVHDLTEAHLRTAQTEDGPVTGTEPPLLVLLEQAVASTTTSRSGGGGGGNSSPVDLGALQLLEGIRAVVDKHWPHAGDRAWAHITLRRKVRYWANHAENPLDVLRLTEHCLHWAYQIREQLEPTKRVPMRHLPCPNCHHGYVDISMEGESPTYTPALQAVYASTPRVECLACLQQWEGGALLDLRAATCTPPQESIHSTLHG